MNAENFIAQDSHIYFWHLSNNKIKPMSMIVAQNDIDSVSTCPKNASISSTIAGMPRNTIHLFQLNTDRFALVDALKGFKFSNAPIDNWLPDLSLCKFNHS